MGERAVRAAGGATLNLRTTARTLYLLLAWAFLAAMVLSAAVAGLALRSAEQDYEPHAGVSHVLAHGALIAMLPLAFVAGLGWRLTAATGVLVVALFVPPLGTVTGGVAAYHMAAALVAFGLGAYQAFAARRFVGAPLGTAARPDAGSAPA